MRETTPASLGSAVASFQAQLDRLRREQTARVKLSTDLADVTGHLVHGQAYVWDVPTGALIPVRPLIIPHFSFNGTLTVTTSATCPPHVFEEAWTSSNTRATITAAGTSSSTFTLYKNGASFTTVTISGTGTTSGPVAIVESFATGDALTCACTTVGSGSPGYGSVRMW